jgi:hypothetical protein
MYFSLQEGVFDASVVTSTQCVQRRVKLSPRDASSQSNLILDLRGSAKS